MATTILRVKRRLDESPANALIVQSKKAKLDDEITPDPSIFVFSATVDEKEESIKFIKNAIIKSTEKNEKKIKISNRDVFKKNESKRLEDKRMKIINYTRGLFVDDVNVDDNESPTEYALLDVHHPDSENDTENYTFDLYVSQGNNLDISNIDDFEETHTIKNYCHERLCYGNMDQSDDEPEEDEDSNDENNWRNEYPDSDGSITEDAIVKAVENINIDDELSSDDYEDIYTDDNNKLYKINPSDIDKYGLGYAKYKAKVLTTDDPTMPKLIEVDDSQIVHGNSDDEDFYYPKNDDSWNVSPTISGNDENNSDIDDVDFSVL